MGFLSDKVPVDAERETVTIYLASSKGFESLDHYICNALGCDGVAYMNCSVRGWVKNAAFWDVKTRGQGQSLLRGYFGWSEIGGHIK